MKISKTDYNFLKSDIQAVNNGICTIDTRRKWLIDNAKYKDLETRLRWDFFNFVNQQNNYKFNKLYVYLNDTHIDTALKKIIKEIEGN